MFAGCTSLTNAPDLPAKTLAQSCYMVMFSGCTSLTTVPALGGETLADSCCSAMFTGCTALVTAPALTATTLAKNCYLAMFHSCTSLKNAPTLPATTLAKECYRQMFYNCRTLTSAPALAATTLAESCYEGMFYNCFELETAPALPAKTLVKKCYYEMFHGCTSLRNIICLATDISAENCVGGWTDSLPSYGYFTKDIFMTGWTENSTSGIPSGWTLTDNYLLVHTPGSNITVKLETNTNNWTIEYSRNSGQTWTTFTNGSSISIYPNNHSPIMLRGKISGNISPITQNKPYINFLITGNMA
jgi:hypothetical protein